MPARWRMLVTKATKPSTGYPLPTLTDGPTLRAAAGSLLCLMLVTLLGLALATLLRDTSGAITLGLGILYIVPVLSNTLASPTWQHLSEIERAPGYAERPPSPQG
ncbi:hypothetical protein ABZY09_23530 [Streptomyces sp. NPDC002928]|uniref:hypothetical protein n=1 Tax=Streptomyces sp. NPDC002928 TaxID=3154440 RepID=UPI0033B48C86